MTKYIKQTLNLGVFLIVAFIGFTIINAVTQNKLTRLALIDDITTGTMSEFKASLRDKERRLQCMTQNIYWEAASEPPEGKLAVAQVVINRMESGRFPKDPCQVIYQKNIVYEKTLCQFSWYCEQGTSTRPVHRKLWDESREAAKMVLFDGFRLPELKDALYYHADYVNPQWNKTRIAKIGRHVFYK